MAEAELLTARPMTKLAKVIMSKAQLEYDRLQVKAHKLQLSQGKSKPSPKAKKFLLRNSC